LWPAIAKNQKPLDLLIALLNLISLAYKPKGLSVLILDKLLQESLFQKRERKQHYKKLMAASAILYSVFANEEEFMGPRFKSIEEADFFVRNKDFIMIPIKPKENSHVWMVL